MLIPVSWSGNATRFSMTSRDETKSPAELKALLTKYEQKLRNNEARIRTLIETIPLGLLIAEKSGIVQSASPASLALFRCTYADLHQRHIGEVFELEQAAAEQLLSAPPNTAVETIAKRFDGSTFPATVKVSPFAGSTESASDNVLLVVEDVSARHDLEQLRQEFISTMTHDLRTPLTSVKCFFELVAEGVYDDRPDDLKAKCEGIGQDTTRLINMINSLLDLHKLEAGKLKLHPRVVALGSIVTQSLQSLDSWAQSRGVPLVVDDIPDELPVTADTDYTVRVLINLLSNAVKFSPAGSAVTISCEATEQFAKLYVSDKGRGIPKDFQSRLFNRFEQAQLSDSRVEGGTGLGLAISKAIVEAQGGTIGVESEPGEGCRFWFTIARQS